MMWSPWTRACWPWAKVLYHCSFADSFFKCATLFQKGGRPLTSDSSFVSSTDIRKPWVYREEDDGFRVVLQIFAV